MTKTNILIIVLVLLSIFLIGNFIYLRYFYDPLAEIGKQNLNNINGEIESVKGDNLLVVAEIPVSYDPASMTGYQYSPKKLVLKISSSTDISLQSGSNLPVKISGNEIKAGDGFFAVTSTNVFDAIEIDVSQLIIYR